MTCLCLRQKLKLRPDEQIPCHSSFSKGIICGPHRGSFAVRDHLRSNLGIICGRGSIAALYSISLHVNIFAFQDKDDDTQHQIDQDQPLLEQTLLMMESTPSQDNRDIIIDVTLFSDNLAEVRNWLIFFFRGNLALRTTFAKITKTYTTNSLVNTHIIIWNGI